MGLFSSKKKTTVGTSVMRMVEDLHVPDTVLSTLVRHSQNSDARASLTDSLSTEVMNGPQHKFERMYRFAEQGHYYYGLPNARILGSDAGAPIAKAAIEAELGHPVTIDYLHFRPPNNIHFGWQHLTEQLGYNHRSNEIAVLSAATGFRVYLDDLVALHEGGADENTVYGVFGEISPRAGFTPERQSRSANELAAMVKDQSWVMGHAQEAVRIDTIWQDNAGNILRQSYEISLASLDHEEEYYQARYRYSTGDGDQIGYWIYKPGTGIHPELDKALDSNYTSPGTYFPFVMFRHHRENRTADHLMHTEEFKSTEALLKKLKIDYKALGDSIHENPDIGDVDQAVMLMGVPIGTDNPIEKDYLYRYFANIHSQAPQVPPEQLPFQNPVMGYGQLNNWAVEIADADFRILIGFSHIARSIRPGTLGPIGTVTNSVQGRWEPVPGETSLNIPAQAIPVRIFRKQVTATFFDEIAIFDPRMRYDIYRGKGVNVDAHDTEGQFLVPIDRMIARRMSPLDREKLYYRSLHLVANSRVTQSVPWYKSRVFGYVLLVVAIVLTVLDFGADGGSFISSAMAFIAGLTVKKVVIFLLSYLLVQQATAWLASKIGAEWATVLAIVAAVAGYSLGNQASSTVGSELWADNLLRISSGLTEGAGSELQRQIAGYLSDKQEFELMTEEKWQELEEVRQLLDRRIVDPFVFVALQPFTIWGETPDSYYDRTVHSGNVGTVAYEFVQSFVDISLKLPDTQSTIGETIYGT